MATSGPSSQMDPSAGGGGSNWERDINNQDISTAKPAYNPATGQWGWQLPNGAWLTGNGAGENGNSLFGPYQGGYQFDRQSMPPSSLQNNETYYGPNGGSSQGQPGGGGGGPAADLTKSSIWKKVLGGGLVSKAVDIGANLLGNEIQSRQTSKAVEAQVDAANRALELQKNVYLQQRSDLMPYADMGRGAIGDMGRMTGTTPVSAPTRDYFADDRQAVRSPGGTPTTVPAANYTGGPGTAVPRGSLATLGTTGTVNMLTPDGRPARVPQAQVQAALQAGGRLA